MDRSQLTPLFHQYYQLKDENPGCLMLMRVGDFFEAYGEDASTLARDADIVQTSKEAGGGQRLAMAGVPHFSLEPYLRTLIEKGHRVAIAEQMEAATGKGLVRREVSRVVTAGTVLDPQMLDEQSHNYLLCLYSDGDEVGLAACDVTTGDFLCTELPNSEARLAEEIYRYRPSELILAGEGTPAMGDLLNLARADGIAVSQRSYNANHKQAEENLKRQFRLRSLQACDLIDRRAATLSAAALLSYLQETTRLTQQSLECPRHYSLAEIMTLDTTSLRNLEVCETLMGRERRGSLLWALDQCVTAMGSRLLRQWLTRPLLDREQIEYRQDAVQALVDDFLCCQQLRKALSPVKDMERLMARVVYQSANARDLLALARSLEVLPDLEGALPREQGRWKELALQLQVDPQLRTLLLGAIAEDPPQSLREGGMIRPGYSAALDELRETSRSAKNWMASLEEREREATGIRSLKVGYNQVFGYYLEVTRSHQKSVPDHYIRKQTLANAERYFTPELKEIETRVLGAEDKIRELEYELFLELRGQVASYNESLRRAARAVAETDVYACMAESAVRYRWVRPQLVDDNLLDLKGARHPVVERSLDGAFISNDCHLDSKRRLVVLTGPNMSGKSTFLRQTALCVIMAQIGCYIPADSAVLGIHDRVFTRVGASDDLHLGQSTFMVEMSEAANILRNATPRSLVILDEIGRGTSTYDGLALARSIAEYLYQECGSKTLFATHFHELTRLAQDFKGIINLRVAVQESRDEVVFLHKIVPGGADRSYGIYVGQLAGLPQWVLDRAHKLLTQLEKESRSVGSRPAGQQQLSLFFDPAELVADLSALQLEQMKPEQVQSWVENWKARL